ncbi:hypothetical protein AQ436_00120 [Arthrobacter sp. EpRS66]|nr:hypothetical protein AQ436_00120 [Arthrobacter sp. EpRS66]
MTKHPNLRAVSAGEKPEKSLTVSEAAKRGTARDLLVATRDRIALAVENTETPARDLAALTKRLMETVREIEAIDARALEEGSSEEVTDGEFDATAV